MLYAIIAILGCFVVALVIAFAIVGAMLASKSNAEHSDDVVAEQAPKERTYALSDLMVCLIHHHQGYYCVDSHFSQVKLAKKRNAQRALREAPRMGSVEMIDGTYYFYKYAAGTDHQIEHILTLREFLEKDYYESLPSELTLSQIEDLQVQWTKEYSKTLGK